MCILNRVDTNSIRRRRPSENRDLMPDGDDLDAILQSALATEVLLVDNFEAFRADGPRCLPKLLRPCSPEQFGPTPGRRRSLWAYAG